MSKELKRLIPDDALECLKVLKTSANTYCYFNNDQCEYNKGLADNIEKSLKRLVAIDDANPSEALESLDRLEYYHTMSVHDLGCKEHRIEDINTIKQYILKTQYLEKEKLLFKNLRNTKVKAPLVGIFNGLSQEERYKFIEHIYYNWEEMKEELEKRLNAETEAKEMVITHNFALRNENAKYKRVLNIIKEKKVDTRILRNCLKDKTPKDYNFLNNKHQLTQEEFDLLKEFFRKDKSE